MKTLNSIYIDAIFNGIPVPEELYIVTRKEGSQDIIVSPSTNSGFIRNSNLKWIFGSPEAQQRQLYWADTLRVAVSVEDAKEAVLSTLAANSLRRKSRKLNKKLPISSPEKNLSLRKIIVSSQARVLHEYNTDIEAAINNIGKFRDNTAKKEAVRKALLYPRPPKGIKKDTKLLFILPSEKKAIRIEWYSRLRDLSSNTIFLSKVRIEGVRQPRLNSLTCKCRSIKVFLLKLTLSKNPKLAQQLLSDLQIVVPPILKLGKMVVESLLTEEEKSRILTAINL